MSDLVIELLRDEATRRTLTTPAPPTPERVRTAARRRRRLERAGATVAAVAVAAAVAGVVAPRPSHTRAVPVAALPALTGDQRAERDARARAEALLERVVLPPGAQQVGGSTIPALSRPPILYSLNHLVDATRFWHVPGTVREVDAFFTTHGQLGRPPQAAGRAGAARFLDVGGLILTYAAVDASIVGVRVDAEIVWYTPRSEATRIHAGITSVDVEAYEMPFGRPMRVLARRAVTGEQARHLADLVNAMHIDVGNPRSCPADNGGGRRRLVFHRAGGHQTVDGFFCGTAALSSVNGPSVGLDVTVELSRAMDAILAPAGTRRH